MKRKHCYVLIFMLAFTTGINAQLGIRAGVNMANEIKSFSQQAVADAYSSSNLTGYQIGLVYQASPKKSGLGCEVGALLSQKGSTFAFSDSTDAVGVIKKGYRELNYIEVPFSVRYRLSIGFIGVYGTAGIYGGYALNGKTVNEITAEFQNDTYNTFSEHIDYGYNFGAGLELLKKIQFGATWSQGLRNMANSNALPTLKTSSNKVFSMNLVYLF